MNHTTIESLQGVLQRNHVLDAYRDGPASRMTIADRAGCSRATVYRAESHLDDQGLIEKTEEGYRITGAGRTVLDQIAQFQVGLEGVLQLQPLLSHVDASILTENIHLLVDAELVEDDPSNPYNIEHYVRSLTGKARDRIVGLTGSLGSPMLIETTYKQVCAGSDLEWTLTRESFDHFRTTFGDIGEAIITHEDTTFYVFDEVPFDLAIYDQTLAIFGFDYTRGVLAVVAVTDDPDAVAWGGHIIDECRTQAERVA